MSLTLKKHSGEQALALGLLTAVLLLGCGLTLWVPLKEFLAETARRASLSGLLTLPVLKALGLAVVGQLAESICKDAGQSSAASAMQLVTAAAILSASLPLLRLLTDAVFRFS